MSEEITTSEEMQNEEVTETIEIKAVTPQAKQLQRGVDDFMKVQGIMADAMTTQNNRTAEFVKNRLEMDLPRPGAAMVESIKGIGTRSEKTEDTTKTSATRLPVRGLAKNGVDRILNGQEAIVDLSRKQNSLFLEGLEEISRFRVSGLTRRLARISGEAVRNLLNTQEELIGLNSDYVNANRELLTNEENADVETLQNFANESAELTINTSKEILEFAKERTEEAFEGYANDINDVIDPEQPRAAVLDVAESGLERIAKSQDAGVKFARDLSDRVFAN